jgi:hypothetical protein
VLTAILLAVLAAGVVPSFGRSGAAVPNSPIDGSQNDGQSPIGTAMQWVSQITTVALEMVLPGIAGHWLDKRWGTEFLALLGFGIGVPLAIWHLLLLSKRDQERRSRRLDKTEREKTDRGGQT